ncbi:hypothetical protein Trydic_g5912 [Trypoxylus dichotomus]
MKAFPLFLSCILSIAFLNAPTTYACDTMCPLLYDPLCAEDSNGDRKTFDSPCQFNIENCHFPQKGLKMVNQGICVTFLNGTVADDRPTICPLVYEPVCGKDSDGNTKTFNNMCEKIGKSQSM